VPYVDAAARKRLAAALTVPDMTSAGELNWTLTQVVVAYLSQQAGGDFGGLNYQLLNDAVGAMGGALAEFQRRVVGPYEDTKIKANGDVYPTELVSAKSRPERQRPAPMAVTAALGGVIGGSVPSLSVTIPSADQVAGIVSAIRGG
jgi:hypothetical protein